MAMGTGRICNALHGLKPVLLMVVVQFAFAGVNVLYKLAANDGMNLRILVAYRFIFGTAFLLPIALFFESQQPKPLTLDWRHLLWEERNGRGKATMAQNFYIESLGLTSATYAVAFNNLIPVITFLVALCFRMEKLALGTRTGRAKIVGTLVCVGGTMIFTFYKGHEIVIWSTDVNLLRKYSHQNSHVLHRNTRTQLLGSVLALCSSISFALWLIFQKKMTRDYPCQYSSTALMSIMASMQSTVFPLCRERDWSQWKLGWDIKLFTAVYSGVITSGLVLTLTAWCVRMRGPLFVAIFNPLGLLLVGLAATLLLDEKLPLGSNSWTKVCNAHSVELNVDDKQLFLLYNPSFLFFCCSSAFLKLPPLLLLFNSRHVFSKACTSTTPRPLRWLVHRWLIRCGGDDGGNKGQEGGE
ncbi:WAT1-related protein [Pyrus ussuriensis x Pyrus communis]|uniref:WAT1-related protein n=1 Tax=Pyrus ussuriensis x Pyrus communis TaxID=2448454 RepID=A0A5N5HKP6_9ROSA|nr:WAT1-related protein [Pyrus ussuriensis x Pyrus communis]